MSAQLKLDMPFGQAKARALTVKALLDRYQVHNRTPVLLLDEAQEMPDDLLDTLRGLLDYVCDAFSPFALVLSGHVDLPRDLVYRDIKRSLAPFSPEDTMAYVQHQMQVAGATRPIFTEQALVKLHQTSKGKAREVNRTATLCLLLLRLMMSLNAQT